MLKNPTEKAIAAKRKSGLDPVAAAAAVAAEAIHAIVLAKGSERAKVDALGQLKSAISVNVQAFYSRAR